jgi:ribosomal protein L11 methyltransferase
VKTAICVSAVVTKEEYETVCAHLYVNDLQGCEEVTLDNECIHIKAYFFSETAAQHVADVLGNSIRHADRTAIAPVVNQDWNAQWRKSMQPAQLAPSWWVSPLWLPPQQPFHRWIKIEPKMAFGTGHHETTRLAAQALIGAPDIIGNAALLDIGTGSGVLCFTGALLGAARCIGVDIDADCRENIAENRMLNRDAGLCSFIIGPIDALKETATFKVIVMNMIHTESAPVLVKCSNILAEQGILIWSGILDNEHDAAISAAEQAGFHLRTYSVENEWWCGIFFLCK